MSQRIPRGRRELGASSAEYALLVAAIAAVIVLIVFALGQATQGSYSNTCSAFESKAQTGANC